MNALCLKYRPALVAYLQRQNLGADVEDVAQEVLLGLVEALPRVHSTAGRFRSLVFAVARNHVRNYFAKQGTLKRGSGRVRLSSELDHVSADAEPDDLFDREWLNSIVQRCLRRLKEAHVDQYQALKLFVLQGQPQAEIAVELGISASALRKRVFRGKQHVVGYLREEVWSYALSPRDVEEELKHLTSLLGTLGEGVVDP